MKKTFIFLSLFPLLVLTSCNSDPLLENIINFKNRVNNLKELYYVNGDNYYFGKYYLNSYYQNNDNYEILSINGNIVYQYYAFITRDQIEVENVYGDITFNLISGNLNSNQKTSLLVNLNFKNRIYYDISYVDASDSSQNYTAKYYINKNINLSYDLNKNLINLDDFVNDYYPNIVNNKNTLIEVATSKSMDINSYLFSYSDISNNYSNNTYLRINRDILNSDKLLNKGSITEYVSYFDIYPYVDGNSLPMTFYNGQLEKISRIANYNNEDNSEIFIFNEEFRANRYEEYIYEEPNKIDYELIENTSLSNITLSYKSNLRDILNLLA